MTTTPTSGAADLRTAAQAVVDRWDTPLWKDAPATAEYIGRLRAALAAGQATAAPAQPAPSGATEEVENLRKALVYAAFALHDAPQYMLAQGITLIDGDTVRVSRDGWTVEASVNPHRQPAPATQQAGAADEAPLSSLPSWEECQLRVSNSDFLAKRVAEGGYGADSDSKVATELHRFLYEYDDQDPYRSAWFRHRLEKVLTECASHGQAPAGATEPTEQQILEAAEKAGLWPNTVHSWIPAFHRYHKELAKAQPAPAQPDSVLEDAARLNWLLTEGSSMAINSFGGQYRVVDVSCNLVVTDWMPTQRAAIDEARKQGVSHDR